MADFADRTQEEVRADPDGFLGILPGDFTWDASAVKGMRRKELYVRVSQDRSRVDMDRSVDRGMATSPGGMVGNRRVLQMIQGRIVLSIIH